MKHRHAIRKLAKFLVTILGREPDQFGLLLDSDGYVTIKALMKALAEEPGWRHIRSNQLREVIYMDRSPVIQIDGNRIRAVDRSNLQAPQIVDAPPKQLYYPVRRKAYPGILERGLRMNASLERIILAADRGMADRLGRRIDSSPVILTVNTEMARSLGVGVWRYGRRLYLLDGLPNGCFNGPPLPKQSPEARTKRPAEAQEAPKTPGSYLMNLATERQPANRPAHGKRRSRKNEWKRERKRRNRMDDTRDSGA